MNTDEHGSETNGKKRKRGTQKRDGTENGGTDRAAKTRRMATDEHG
jgi:hypothetical protein